MRPETQAQIAMVEYLRLRGFLVAHVPNGSHLAGDSESRARQTNSLKRSGMLPGFPDLIIYHTEGRLGHIEVKSDSGKPTPAQLDIETRLLDRGHNYAVCRSIEDVDRTLAKWGW